MTTSRALPRYGRIEVGQRVRYERLVPAPTPEPSAHQWGRGGHVVSIATLHTVREIRLCDSGALVTLQHADGHGEIRACFNAYGQSWGGFGGLDVLKEAPIARRHESLAQAEPEPINDTEQLALFA